MQNRTDSGISRFNKPQIKGGGMATFSILLGTGNQP